MTVLDVLGVLAYVAVFGPVLWLERRTQNRMVDTIEPTRSDDD
jgi:hypothetical protein